MRKTIGLSLALLFVSASAMAKGAHPAHHHYHHRHHHHLLRSAKAKSAATTAAMRKSHRHHRHHGAHAKLASHAGARRLAAVARHVARYARRDARPDEYIGKLRVVGARQVGYAAWYGGRHVGRRTASGERLDRVHVTAAHRSLPLHSLVRVTNLRNGRSVVATINDRGPVSHRLLIDMSPKAAKELHMIDAGIAAVAIVPVARVTTRRN